MDTKPKIEKEFLKAMSAIDEAQYLIHKLPDQEPYGCMTSNLSDMKGKLKYYLNTYFDKLARERGA